jgi:RNA polymerase sigma-70 factor (ECF subfamily)
MRGVDEERLVQMLKRNARCLRRFLFSHGASTDEADDLAQDIFAVAWKKREVILNGKARQYLSSVARRILMAHRRKKRIRERWFNGHRGDILRAVHPGASNDPFETGDSDAYPTRRLCERLEELPGISRDVLELVYLRGMTRKQAAETLGCSVNAIEKREKRALRQLKSLIQGRDGETFISATK